MPSPRQYSFRSYCNILRCYSWSIIKVTVQDCQGRMNPTPIQCLTCVVIDIEYLISCALSFWFEWVYLLKRSPLLCLIETLHIAASKIPHNLWTYDETYWFWTACGKNKHVRVCPFLIKSSVLAVYFLSAEHAMWNYFSLTLLFLQLSSLIFPVSLVSESYSLKLQSSL